MRTVLGLLVFASLFCGVPRRCSAQPAPDSETHKDFLKPGKALQPSVAAEPGSSEQQLSRPVGFAARPKDGVQHPDLDKAWAEYGLAVDQAVATIKAAISKQFDAARLKGNLDNCEKWQSALKRFEKAGELPVEGETKAAMTPVTNEYKKAKDKLLRAYDEVVKDLTIKSEIDEAKLAKEESRLIRESHFGGPPNAQTAKTPATDTQSLRPNITRKQLPNGPSLPAKLVVTCDNAYNVWLNGVKVGSGNNYSILNEYLVPIREGDVLAIEATDDDGGSHSGGLFCCLVLQNGKAWGTNKDWQCTTVVPPDGWQMDGKPLPGGAIASEENVHPAHKQVGPPREKLKGRFIWSADASRMIWVRQVIDFRSFQ